MITDPVLEGGCLCGAVAYRASPPSIVVTYCHCVSCRRAVGAPMVTWATFRRSDVTFTRGALAWFRSSPKAERGFCVRCGTSVAYRNDDFPGEIDLTVGSLEQPDRVEPDDHIWTGSKIRWLRFDDGLPQLAHGHYHHGYPGKETAPDSD